MIDTLFFALQIIGVVTLLGWAVIHDRLAEGAETVGPLAFKQEGGHAADDRRPVRNRMSGAGKRRRSIRNS